MLTPFFELSQTDKEVMLLIGAPMCNINDTELRVDEDQVLFYSRPYYLRIHLPGKVQEDVAPGTFDCDKGELKFVLKKCIEGQYFSDLDLVGKLLNPSGTGLPADVVADEASDSEDDNKWLVHQEPCDNTPPVSGPAVGFPDRSHALTSDLRNEFFEILDISNVNTTDKKEWSLERRADERAKFSEDHYLADFMDPTPLREMMDYVPPYQTSLLKGFKVELTKEEKEELKNIGNRELSLDSGEKQKVLLSLVDIIYGYAYNARTTLGESTVESAWTVSKLSSTLSWLETFGCMRDVKLASMRRSLVFPLFRHWDLSVAVANDTLTILKLGKRQILKCLLDIHRMFGDSEPRYLLNHFFITDYCIWLQKVSDKSLWKLADSYAQIQVCKGDMELELEELEAAALIVQQEEAEVVIAGRLADMALCRHPGYSDTSESSSDCESCESTESEWEEGSHKGSHSSSDASLNSGSPSHD